MTHDHDEDIRPAAEAPDAWTDGMVQAALEAGLAIETPAGPSVSKALKRTAERIGAWADDPALGNDIQKLLESDADCEKVAQQLAAARKALDKTFFAMVGCVIAQGDLPPDDVADLLARFS